MATHTWGLENEVIEHWAFCPVFTNEECDTIIEYGNKLELIQGQVENEKEKINTSIRKSNIAWVPVEPESRWIFQKCVSAITQINSAFFNFDLHRIEALQFSTYNIGEFYVKHTDMHTSGGTGNHRKLSFSIQLSSPEDYKDGELLLHYTADSGIAKKERGVASFFPSYMLHEVTPVTSGKRYALVGWVAGPRFK
jgi:PKHD-type hydroxylase